LYLLIESNLITLEKITLDYFEVAQMLAVEKRRKRKLQLVGSLS